MNNIAKRLGAIVLLALPVAAFAISEQELELFKSLPPAQQKAFAKQFGLEAGELAPKTLEQPEVVVPLAMSEGTQTNERGGDELQPYGYDLFAGAPTTFAPATDVPVPADYVMGPGDTIQVQEFGKEADSYELLVDREGNLTLPGVGQLNVIGMHFADLKARVVDRIETQKIGVTASVTMGSLRSIRVFVLGEARRPGSYTVSALTTMTNALFVSGGVKTIGSLRRVQLKRAGDLVAELDLYDLLMRGDTSGDVRLQPGDVIFIPPKSQSVAIEGAVIRPAIYELKNENTVAQALALAGGLADNAWRDRASLERIDSNGERELINVSLRATPKATLIHGGDKLIVRQALNKVDRVVTVSGFAERVGRFAPVAGMKVTDLIPSPDALKVGADLDFGLLTRRNLDTGHISVEYLHPGLAFLRPKGEENKLLTAGDELVFFEAQEEQVEPEVDVSELDAASQVGSSRANAVRRVVGELLAQANDQNPALVTKVAGAVRFPGRYPLDVTGTRISDLLRASGGLSESAYLLEAEVSRYSVTNANGEQRQQLQHLSVDLSAIYSGDQEANITLRPRDVLTVRYIPEWDRQYEVSIKGEVRFPGSYPVKQGETILDLIARAGGMTSQAYAPGAAFVRQDLRQKEREQARNLTRRLESDLAALSLKELAAGEEKAQAYLAAQGLLDDLKKYEAVGRLVIDLPSILNGESPALQLDDGDELIIPSLPTEVTVIGEVQFPTSHVFSPKKSRWSYIDSSGGLTERADKKRVFVVKANGAVLSGRVDIDPGDTVVVPLDADRIRPITLWTSISQIIYQLGLSAASFKAIGAF